MNIRSEVRSIIRAAKILESEYQSAQGLILSESDLKCLLYSRMLKRHAKKKKTMNRDVKTIRLHSGIPWYNMHGRISYRPKIAVLMNPERLSVRHGVPVRKRSGKVHYHKLHKKEFDFRGDAVIVDLKFIGSRSGITSTKFRQIKNDIKKMARLAQRYHYSDSTETVDGIMIIFNKTDLGSHYMENLIRDYRDIPFLRIIYCTGNVSP